MTHWYSPNNRMVHFIMLVLASYTYKQQAHLRTTHTHTQATHVLIIESAYPHSKIISRTYASISAHSWSSDVLRGGPVCVHAYICVCICLCALSACILANIFWRWACDSAMGEIWRVKKKISSGNFIYTNTGAQTHVYWPLTAHPKKRVDVQRRENAMFGDNEKNNELQQRKQQQQRWQQLWLKLWRNKEEERKTEKDVEKCLTHTVNKWTHYEMFALRYSPTFSGSIVLYISENMMIDQSNR